ncbi:MAG: DUF58 domain-containing protein [Bdellovibrionales bacterium]|nr:DUF58 domain-containing protein [Bdellovibrionales bacterium]
MKKVKQIDIRLRRKVHSLFSGAYRSSIKGQGMVFSHVREYVPGDDIRSMAWNLTAKMSKPYVKLFEEDKHSQILLVLDISSSMDFGVGQSNKRSVLENLSSLLAFCALKNKDLLGLLLFSSDIDLYLPPKKGKTHIFHVVRQICGFQKNKSHFTDLNKALSFLYKVLNKRTQIFIFSDFLNSSPFERALRNLERKHEIVNFVIYDLFEESIPSLGLVDLEDLETGELKTLDFSFRSKSINSDLKESRELREKQFKKSQSERVLIKCQDDIYRPLISFFKKRSLFNS